MTPAFTLDVDRFYQDSNGNYVCEKVADYVCFSKAEEIHTPNGKVRYTSPVKYYVQRGVIYDGGGRPVPFEEAPAWVLEEYRKTSRETRQAVGLKLPEDILQEREATIAEMLQQWENLPEELRARIAQQILPEASRIDEKAPKISSEYDSMSLPSDGLKNDPRASRPKTWVCDECTQEVLLAHKGVHIGKHRREAKHQAKLAGV